jgi:oligopeptide/dipeptide ABC transporter ATP-binding protein
VTAPNAAVLLRVRDLKTYFVTEHGKGTARAVDDVSFDLYPGETLGIVGESGCGKTVTSLSILRLVPEPPGHILPGSVIEFEGRNLLALTAAELRAVRGNQIAMIFQEPMTSLNPVFTIGDQIAEAAIIHQHLSRRAARARAIEMLRLVGIPDPDKGVDHYPHQLSGGMRQRAMIAMALSCNPSLLIADEPTTALDVTIQAQILDLIRGLQKRLGMAVMFITHNLGVIAQIADSVAIMYLGQVVEYGPVREILRNPKHPYTADLLRAVPRLGKTMGQRLVAIEGNIPSPFERPSGCPFHPRCSKFMAGRCEQAMPGITAVNDDHTVRCFLYEPG